MSFTPQSRKDQNCVQRLAQRGRYDEDAVFRAVDECPVAHVTFALPEESNEYPSVIPMIYGRRDHTIYLHGHLSSRLLKTLSEVGVKCCATFTTVTGLVVSLTPFHNSNNYNSAVVYGCSRLVDDEAEKTEALTLITNHAFREAATGEVGDRWADSRPTSTSELKSTRVVALDIDMASAKSRTGEPSDDQEDVQRFADKYWTGTLVRESRYTKAIPASYNAGVPTPNYIQRMVS